MNCRVLFFNLNGCLFQTYPKAKITCLLGGYGTWPWIFPIPKFQLQKINSQDRCISISGVFDGGFRETFRRTTNVIVVIFVIKWLKWGLSWTKQHQPTNSNDNSTAVANPMSESCSERASNNMDEHWWLGPPIAKICSSNLIESKPRRGLKFEKSLKPLSGARGIPFL